MVLYTEKLYIYILNSFLAVYINNEKSSEMRPSNEPKIYGVQRSEHIG